MEKNPLKKKMYEITLIVSSLSDNKCIDITLTPIILKYLTNVTKNNVFPLSVVVDLKG